MCQKIGSLNNIKDFYQNFFIYILQTNLIILSDNKIHKQILKHKTPLIKRGASLFKRSRNVHHSDVSNLQYFQVANLEYPYPNEHPS